MRARPWLVAVVLLAGIAPAVALEKSLEAALAIVTLGLFNVSMFAVSIMGGMLSDRIGRRPAGLILIVTLTVSL